MSALMEGTMRFVSNGQPAGLLQRVATMVAEISDPDGDPPTQYEFNRHKPIWMPIGSAIPQMFGCSWADLVSGVAIPIRENGAS